MAAATICQVARKGPDRFLSRPTPPSGSSAHLQQNPGPHHGTKATVMWLLPRVWAPRPTLSSHSAPHSLFRRRRAPRMCPAHSVSGPLHLPLLPFRKPSLRVAACRRSAHFLHVSAQMSLLFKREAFPVHSRSLLPLYFSAQQCRYVSLKPGDSQQVLGKYLLTTQTLC